MENERRNCPEHERKYNGEHCEVERVPNRLDEALVCREIHIIVESHKMRDRSDLPIERAHPDGEHSRENDYRADNDDGRDDEAAIVAAPSREKARRLRR